MKKQKANAQKVRNLSLSKCIICNKKTFIYRGILTDKATITVSLCEEHESVPDLEILDVIYNNAEKMI